MVPVIYFEILKNIEVLLKDDLDRDICCKETSMFWCKTSFLENFVKIYSINLQYRGPRMSSIRKINKPLQIY